MSIESLEPQNHDKKQLPMLSDEEPVVNGTLGTDFGPIPLPTGSLEVLRASDTINGEMNTIVPVDMSGMGRSVVPKGQNSTLGNVQIAQGQMDSRMGIKIMTRNKTFFGQVMYLIAQMEISWETDETIAREAAARVKLPPPPDGSPQPQFQPPMQGNIIDFRKLDLNFAVSINTGMGALPLQQKGQGLIQIAETRQKMGVATDFNEVCAQLNVIAGYDRDAFTPKVPPTPAKPPVDYKVGVTVDLNELLRLAPEAGQFLLQKMMSGDASVDVKVKDNSNAMAQQNGGGFMTPNHSGETVDATGPEAMAMSQGGQQNGR
jgi:hypothetical protein